jgi:hypothetical protein
VVQHADIDHTGLTGVGGGASDLVFVATSADTAINSVTDITIVSQAITGVVADDVLIVDAYFMILNDSGAGRVYNISLDFDAAFPAEFITGSLANSSTLNHPFHLSAMLYVRSSSSTIGMAEIDGNEVTGIADDANKTMNSSGLGAKVWGVQAGDMTGSCTVALFIRSASATATQTCKLVSFVVRKANNT